MTERTTLTPGRFSDAFAAHGRALWCVASGILGRADGAEDVLQEAAIVAMRKLSEFDANTSFIAWMSQIVRYIALNQARRHRRSPVDGVEPSMLAEFATTGGPAAARTGPGTPVSAAGHLATEQAEFDDAVVAALNGLEPTPRACLLMRTVLDLSYREIARALDLPEGTAMSHVHRARHALRRDLEGSSAEGVQGPRPGRPAPETPHG